MRESATDLFAASWAPDGIAKNKAITKASTGIRGVIENVGAALSLIKVDPGFARIAGPEYDCTARSRIGRT